MGRKTPKQLSSVKPFPHCFVSGIGKSAIARVLHTKYYHQFQLCVFMKNIKRRSPKPCFYEYSAKLQLQKEFLSQMINQEDLKINHLGVAENMLKDKRVLVVLDDVDKSAQLDVMAKETQWFGPGSRIIVTTPDKKILKAHGINHIYEVGFPDNNEALQILCMYAFGQNSSYDDALHEWSKELPRLRSSIDGEIESILKFSYDALCHEDQALFLYIACFFNGERSEKVEAHLAENLIDVRQGLRLLAEKSLIFISSLDRYKRMKMHYLLARLGRGIVHKQSIHELENVSFRLVVEI